MSTQLREKMRQDLVLRGMALRSRESYMGAVYGLAKYYRRRPDRLSVEEVQKYLYHLMEERKLAWSSCNVALSGLRFFYGVTLRWPTEKVNFMLPRRRGQWKLPQVLDTSEVKRLLEATSNPKHRVFLMTVYGAGLRVGEAVKLRAQDIDSARMQILIRQGKGNKDRYTLLSHRLLKELRLYWQQYEPRLWLFPGQRPGRHICNTTAQRIYYGARDKAKINKEGGIHILRHSFATHLIENGVELAVVQRLLGHRHLSTTMRYLHLTQDRRRQWQSPLDLLWAELPEEVSAGS